MPTKADRVRRLEPVSVPSAADVVVAQVTRAIEIGRFLPDDQLPPEREFAVQLGVSRVTLRAALRDLEAAGLLKRVERGPGGGALVIAAGPPVTGDSGHHALRKQLDEIYEFRLACESAAAELAAERRTDADLVRLNQAIGELGVELTPGQFRAADNAFHLGVADAADNRRLRHAVEDVRAAMFGPLDAVRFELVLASTVEHHETILAAIADRDTDRAREAIVAHIVEAQQELLVALALAE